MQGLSFTRDNVPLVMNGTKDVTRRLVKLPFDLDARRVAKIVHIGRKAWAMVDAAGNSLGHLTSRYFPGETVFLAEAFGLVGEQFRFRADYEPDAEPAVSWSSPRFMPGTLSRQLLVIPSMRAERVQEISGGDVVREGVWIPPEPPRPPPCGPLPKGECVDLEFLRTRFGRAWDEIKRPKGATWADDPFVFRLEIERTHHPQEQQAHG